MNIAGRGSPPKDRSNRDRSSSLVIFKTPRHPCVMHKTQREQACRKEGRASSIPAARHAPSGAMRHFFVLPRLSSHAAFTSKKEAFAPGSKASFPGLIEGRTSGLSCLVSPSILTRYSLASYRTRIHSECIFN